jgi:hypothetical protein
LPAVVRALCAPNRPSIAAHAAAVSIIAASKKKGQSFSLPTSSSSSTLIESISSFSTCVCGCLQGMPSSGLAEPQIGLQAGAETPDSTGWRPPQPSTPAAALTHHRINFQQAAI